MAELSSRADSEVNVRFSINGDDVDTVVDARVTLLDLLRERLAVTGPKKGCDHGQCGSCTVLVDGRRVNSCLTLAATVDGRDVLTVEGLAPEERLHPLQRAFLEADAYQCGFCTPGQLCSAVAMLAELEAGWPSAVTGDGVPELTEAEIRERMSGNLCRCGAYANLVTAIMSQAG